MTIFFGKESHNCFADRTIPEIFYETVSLFPNNAFVLCDKLQFTYEALATRCEKLSKELIANGISQGHAVMLKIPRGPEFITAALAVLSVGGVFVPVAIDEPTERITHMINKVGITHILQVDNCNKSDFRDIKIQRVYSDSATVYSSDTAYIIHTSGTTGMPKGAVLPIQALKNCLAWHIDFLEFSSSDRISQLSRPTFDFSIPELFLPVVTGGAMVVPTSTPGDNLTSVVQQLAKQNTTVIQMVPTILSRFLSFVETSPHLAQNLQNMKHMVCNGEALTDQLRRSFYRQFPQAFLHNCYGPTEACVAVTAYSCPKDDRPLTIYLGSPAQNVTLHILREDGTSSATHEPAELWIGGKQNALGYANDPAQTQENFKEILVNGIPQRLYRTGDWVISDGNQISYLGRRDNQIKYKGVRIELSEIQKVIESSPLCSEARVLLSSKPDKNGLTTCQVLACFMTPENIDIVALQTYINKMLPADRRPTIFRSLSHFPATANGKLDTHSLLDILEKNNIKKNNACLLYAPEKTSTVIKLLESIVEHSISLTDRGIDIALDSLKCMEFHITLARKGLMLSVEIDFLDELPIDKWDQYILPLNEKNAKLLLEKENTNEEMIYSDISKFFAHLSKKQADFVVLHSSFVDFKKFNTRQILTLTLKEIAKLAEHSTVAIPSFTPGFTRTKRYHYLESQSETGILSTAVQQELSGLRTRHPVYSFTLLGPHAKRLSLIDWWRAEPFGAGSFFEELGRYHSLIGMIGTYSLAHPHRCEQSAAVPYFHHRICVGEMTFETGTICTGTRIYARDFKESEEDFLLAQDVPATMEIIENQLERFSIGNSHGAMIWVEDLEDLLVEKLTGTPLKILHQERAMKIIGWSEFNQDIS